MKPITILSSLRLIWLAFAMVTVMAACADGFGSVRLAAAPGVRVAVQLPDTGFATRSAGLTSGDVAFYRFKLYNVGLATIAAQYQTVATSFTFTTVPNGTYQLKAEAFGFAGQSITAGGEKTSTNTATVASPAVTYSAGTSLAVALPLLAGTGETVYNKVIVTNGNPAPAMTGGNFSATGTVAAVYTVGTGPDGIAFDSAGNAWIANTTANTILKMTSAGSHLATVAVANSPNGIAIDNVDNVYVSCYTGNTLNKYSPGGVAAGTVSTGSGPQSIVIDPNGNAWVANAAGGTVQKVQTATMTSVAQFVTGGSTPVSLALDRYGNPLVGHTGSNDVRKLDPASGTVLATMSNGGPVQGLAVDAVNYFWTSGSSAKRYTSGGSAVSTVAVGAGPWGVLIDPAGRIWVANNSANTVSVLASNGITLATIPVGAGPRRLAVDQQGFVWVTCQNANAVYKLKL